MKTITRSHITGNELHPYDRDHTTMTTFSWQRAEWLIYLLLVVVLIMMGEHENEHGHDTNQNNK